MLCIMFKIDVVGTSQGRHYPQVAFGRNKDVLGTSLPKLWDIGHTQLFLLPGSTLKLYFELNVTVLNFKECVKLTFSERPQNVIMLTSPRAIFHTSFGHLWKIYANIEAVFYVSLYMFKYISICLLIANIEKTMIWKCILKIILKNDVLRTSW